MPKKDYLGKLTGKQIDALPGSINDIVDGRTVVALAANLNCATDLVQSGQVFLMRTSGGSASLRTGEAVLRKMYGLMLKAPDVTENIVETYLCERTEDVPTLSLDAATLRTKMEGEVAKGATITVTIELAGSDWLRDGEVGSLADYGLTVSGTAMADDTIQVVYRRAKIGTVWQATPSEFVALGLNSFNKDVAVLENCGFAADGTIVEMQGNNIGYALAAYNSENEDGYTVYDKNGLLVTAGFMTSMPTVGGVASLVSSPNAELMRVSVPSNNGYVVFEGVDMSGVCVHPAWSGYMDRGYADYAESVVDLSDVALYAVSSVLRDVADFTTGVITRNVSRVVYSAAALAALLTEHPDWAHDVDYVYDEEYIYHRATATTEALAVGGVYTVNDFSVEMFADTTIPPECEIAYGENLVDKLRVDVVTHDEMESDYLPDFDNRIEACENSKEMIEAAMLGDDITMRTLCGQPVMLFGAGTPQEAIVPSNWNQFDPETGEGCNWVGKPIALGQMYVNTSVSSGGVYIAKPSGEYDLAWHLI